MLLYICICLKLLSVVKLSQVKALEPSNVKPVNDGPKVGDAIFGDVIKNISRVNHVLQELINNYEQLQKIYKSQENVDSVDSDSEIDEVYKTKNGKKQVKRTRGKTTKKPISEKFAATQMFWSDHEEDNENSNDETEDEKEAVKETVKEGTLEPKLKETLSTRTTTLRPVSSEESGEESSDTSDVSQGNIKTYKEVVVKKPSQPKLIDSVKSQSEVIFIDTHKKTKKITTPAKQKKKNKINPAVQFAGVPTKKKTRYSKVSHSQGTNSEMQAQNVVSKAGSNDNREVKKIMYAESFSPKKIWNDILNNKPIQLEAHNEITLRRVENVKKRNNTETNKRSKAVGKSAVVLVTKSKNKENKAILSSEDDDSTLKEQFKTNVLRQAYGDACLKLVLRKCHKACKKVSKTACNRVKCKRSAKSAFITAARAGCIKEFNGNTAVTTEGYIDNTLTSFRGQSNKFVDMTRAGFLSAACLPHAQTQKSLRNATQQQSSPEQNFNILRDRYERACKRISCDKCRTACNYATTQMCDTNTCSKRMKKIFKKVCKQHCKTAYGLNRVDSDSESESESVESESDSETD